MIFYSVLLTFIRSYRLPCTYSDCGKTTESENQ